MAAFEYTVVPFTGSITAGSNRGDAEVSEQLNELIEEYAEDDWELHQVASVDVAIKPGCLAALFGASVQYQRFDQVIFKREKGPN